MGMGGDMSGGMGMGGGGGEARGMSLHRRRQGVRRPTDRPDRPAGRGRGMDARQRLTDGSPHPPPRVAHADHR
ncbi:hypothetical protein [Nocardioides convexus]|uniref:hypothetical protein n=1 Tax=Nocardioides convexus TaxID=2712224 RepID=UPI002418395D|nr:hypothetical protein [Nocardioides convexus]